MTAIGLASPSSRGVNSRMDRYALPQPANDPVKPDTDYFRDLLVAVGQKRDRQAFAALFGYYAPRIKSFLMKGGADPETADELAQDTMVTVWQKATSYDPAKASAGTWIFTIARNKRIDGLRKKIRPEIDMDDAELVTDDTPSAVDALSLEEETAIMADALKALPEEQAGLLYKSFFEDKTHADIAREMKLPLGTVKSRIRLALEKLRADKKVNQLWP